MQVMGMKNSVIWSVWILMTFATMVVISAELTAVLRWAGILPLSNPLLVFAMLAVFSSSVVAYRCNITTLSRHTTEK
jgi:hypothetical protein